jgi:hypothetical protein
MGNGQALLGVSRAGGFCAATDEIEICPKRKIRLTGKGSRGISKPTFLHSETH